MGEEGSWSSPLGLTNVSGRVDRSGEPMYASSAGWNRGFLSIGPDWVVIPVIAVTSAADCWLVVPEEAYVAVRKMRFRGLDLSS